MKKINLYSKHLTRVALDLSGRSKNLSFLGISLTVLGLLLVAVMLGSYIDSARKLAMLNGSISNQPEIQGSKPSSNLSSEEINTIQKSLNQLSIPWGRLFSAMEVSSSDKVVLISLEPNAEKRSVRIIAEASDVYEMIDYIRVLSKQPQMYKVFLLNQKAGENQQDPAVRFTLEGYWARP